MAAAQLGENYGDMACVYIYIYIYIYMNKKTQNLLKSSMTH